MMAREFKPGDVAVVSDPVHGRLTMIHVGHDPAERCWHGVLPNGDLRCLAADQTNGVWPLVVIDPEDRAQVERLTAAMRENGWTGIDDEAPDDMQTALRSLIAPPKPPEPTGRYAVVVDASGDEWVRTAEAGPDSWLRSGWFTEEKWTRYADIEAVTVLSEGVTP